MLQFRKHYLLILPVLFFFTSCGKSNNSLKFQGPTMGTQYHITLIPKKNSPPVPTTKIKKNIDDILLNINQQMSTYIPNSEISLFNRHEKLDWFPVSKDFAFVIHAAQKVSKVTQGAFDVTVSPLVDLWGFGKETQINIPTDEQIKKAAIRVGYQLLEVKKTPPSLRKTNKNLHIDLSAIAKGFAVDKIAEYLNHQDFSNYLIEIGGEIRLKGKNLLNKPWKVGIESPCLKKNIKNFLLLSNISLATSGDYRNYFTQNGVRYSHTINPKSGKPITHNLASVTVLHQSTMMADAFATALMVMGKKKGKEFINKHGINASMISREESTYRIWQNIDIIKIPISSMTCNKSKGCVYIEP